MSFHAVCGEIYIEMQCGILAVISVPVEEKSRHALTPLFSSESMFPQKVISLFRI